MNEPRLKDRRLAAAVCLVAMLFVQAPTLAAWAVAAGACCPGDQCPIHGNHHPAKENPAQQSDDAPMDCDHHGHSANKMSSCSMSCCHNVEQAAVHAHIFLLTLGFVPTGLVLRSTATLAPARFKISPAFAPLAPPPKSSTN